MARLKQSKRVSWPTDGNLCKVRLFLSDDALSQSGLGSQAHLQAKAAWLMPATLLLDSDDSPPPGFEPSQKLYHPKIDISQIPVNPWQCPPRLVVNPEWHVVTGEVSVEVAIENQRQPGVLGAVYPRSSSIPRNPFVALEVQASQVDDSSTLIPVIAIEYQDGSEQVCSATPPSSAPMPLHSLLNVGTSMDSIPHLRFTSNRSKTQLNAVSGMHLPSSAESADSVVEPDVAAASAAFTAIVKSSEDGSLVNRDLLIKILNNPNMVEKLVSEYGAPKQTSLPVSAAQSLRLPPTHTDPSAPLPSLHVSMPAPNAPFFHMPNNVASPSLNSYPPPHMPVVPWAVMDVNYYKNLIQLHGGEMQEPLDQNPIQFSVGGRGSNQRDPKARVLKPCTYFNTRRGCRHGASCLFQHDVSSVPLRIEQQKGSTKRIKLDGGIPRRN